MKPNLRLAHHLLYQARASSLPPQLAFRQSLRYAIPLRSNVCHPMTCGIRHASTTSADSVSLVTRIKNLLFGTSIILSGVFVYYYVTDARAGIHRWVVVPGLRYIYHDAEEAHHVANQSLKALYQLGLYPRERGMGDSAGDLQVEVFGHVLHNPIATSAGIDKHADIPDPLFAMGPAIIEIGGCTPLPQSGNPLPRVFRLPSQNALINRYGLNSEGADHVAMRLRHRVREFANSLGFGVDEAAEQRVLNGEAGVPPGSLKSGKLMAVQVAKNKFTPDNNIEAVTNDYVYCVDAVGKYADIIVVNVSSPNTPGLRDLQATAPLTSILKGVVQAARSVDRETKPVVMVKVSPDEDTDDQIMGICDAVSDSGVDGIIVGNTTKQRPESIPAGYQLPPHEEEVLLEQGGFSGPHLFDRTVKLVRRYRDLLDSRLQLTPPSHDSPPPSVSTSDPPDIVPGAPTPPSSIDPPIIADPTTSASSNSSPTPSTDSIPDLPHPSDDGGNADPIPLIPLTSATPSVSPKSEITPISKVIFATGGITNGKQAQEVLDAGASVAMVYTALVYGGVGTISRIKDEIREERSTRAKAAVPVPAAPVKANAKMAGARDKAVQAATGKAEEGAEKVKEKVRKKEKEVARKVKALT